MAVNVRRISLPHRLLSLKPRQRGSNTYSLLEKLGEQVHQQEGIGEGQGEGA